MTGANMSTELSITEKTKIVTKEPSRYKVLFFNDDKTPMDWVIGLLTTIFRHNENSAYALMLQVHHKQSAVVGVYSFEIAESKTSEAVKLTRAAGFPLEIEIKEE
jgi:ATP-dependent Clp protease adaptor protein ClpS